MLDETTSIVALVILAVVAILLNTLCIHIIHSSKSLRNKPSSFLVVNLLAIHLFQGLFVFPLYAGKKASLQSLFWKRFFANGFRLTYMLTFYGTVLGVLFISVDRFLATYWLNLYKCRVTKKRVLCVLLALWLYIIALCAIPFIPNSANTRQPWKYIYVQQEEWVIFMLLVNNLVPYLFILVSYSYIIYRLKEIARKRRNRASSNIELIRRGQVVKMREKDFQRYKKIVKLTLVLTVSYALFWTPSIVYYPMLGFCKSCFPEDYDGSSLEQHVGFLTKYAAFLDAVAAPLIYCFYHGEFRKYLLGAVSSIFRRAQGEEPLTTTLEDSVNGARLYHL